MMIMTVPTQFTNMSYDFHYECEMHTKSIKVRTTLLIDHKRYMHELNKKCTHWPKKYHLKTIFQFMK